MDIHWPYHFEETLRHPREIAQAWQDLGHMYRTNWKGEQTTPTQREHYLQLYEAAVRYTDAQIGRLLDYLERSGRFADTVIILVADHGEEFFERRHWGHFEVNLYDEILRVPLIIYTPELSGGQVERRQVRTLDIMPAILDVCGCPPPDGMEGASLAPLWQSRAEEYPVETSISEMWRNGRHMIALRTDSFKYIWDSRYPDKSELYDLKSDPGEVTDVRGQCPEQAARFQELVDAHLCRVAARPEGASEMAEVELDDLMIDRLRQLGYVE
jgi:arylsulfatase A-like enzyme